MAKIKNISGLITALKSQNPKSETLWFRGHSDESWKLLPSFHRLKGATSEQTLLKKFKQNAFLLLEHKPIKSFEWLFWLQHYGVPTRLLDWTESPLAALYFAVSEVPKKDGALWILSPTKLNENANINATEPSYIPSFEEEELTNYSPESLNGENVTQLLPVATIATRNNPRIQAQLGTFTISHRDKTPIEDIGNKKHIKKLVIPKENKAQILLELELLGFSKFQLFPELSSIGDNIIKGLK